MATRIQDAPARGRFMPARATWRTLLVHVQPETDASPRLTAAVDLAGKLDATLFGFAAEMLQPIAASDPTGLLGGQLLTATLEVLDCNLATATAAFKRETTSLRTEWIAVQAFPTNAATRLARAADLIVAGGSPLDQRDGYRWCDPAELVLQAGRPVLVVPPGGGRLEARRIVVGWKDTREARRAVADGLPILKCADEVLIVEACRPGEAEEAEVQTSAVVEYLQRHGIDARPKVVVGAPQDAAAQLQGEAAALGADLIVTGAYGHSRLGEWVFGGVTSALLDDPQRFLLLSH
jgi:nucleotide-binding universal stress UspA family protein